MKILVLNGSPHLNGNTADMVAGFKAGAEAAGHTVLVENVAHMNIRGCIPNYFKLYNKYSRNPQDDWKITPAYRQLASVHGRAADCVKCRRCEQNCPQHLPITGYLSKVKEIFDSH